MPVHKHRALITGASSGIGETYARRLAGAGSHLVIVARRVERLEALAQELRALNKIEVEVIAADLSTSEGSARVSDRLENGSSISLFVNNAGYASRGKVAELDADALEAMLRVNVIAMTRLSRAAMKRMTAEGTGDIINIASATAFILLPGNAGYGASKSYVMSFTRHMQIEARETGIRVQLLVPGVVATDFHEIAGGNLSKFSSDRIMSREDLVTASLSALEMNEEVCIPSLPEIRDWNTFVSAESKIAENVSRDRIASRYA